MKQIRRALFETNSSSVHTLVIVPSEDYNKWKNNEIVYVECQNRFIDYEDLRAFYYDEKLCDHNDCKDCMRNEKICARTDYWTDQIMTYEGYFSDEFMEDYEEEYKTKSGDEITIFGYYGHD